MSGSPVPVLDCITEACQKYGLFHSVSHLQPLVKVTTGISVSLAAFLNHIPKWAATTHCVELRQAYFYQHVLTLPWRPLQSTALKVGRLSTCPHTYGAGQTNQAVYNSTTWESWVLPYAEAPLQGLLRYRPIPGLEVKHS